VIVLLWSLWGQLFGEYRNETCPVVFSATAYTGLLYRKLDYPGWDSCGFTDLVEVFYLDPYYE
jgi:hypothetical protein